MDRHELIRRLDKLTGEIVIFKDKTDKRNAKIYKVLTENFVVTLGAGIISSEDMENDYTQVLETKVEPRETRAQIIMDLVLEVKDFKISELFNEETGNIESAISTFKELSDKEKITFIAHLAEYVRISNFSAKHLVPEKYNKIKSLFASFFDSLEDYYLLLFALFMSTEKYLTQFHSLSSKFAERALEITMVYETEVREKEEKRLYERDMKKLTEAIKKKEDLINNNGYKMNWDSDKLVEEQHNLCLLKESLENLTNKEKK